MSKCKELIESILEHVTVDYMDDMTDGKFSEAMEDIDQLESENKELRQGNLEARRKEVRPEYTQEGIFAYIEEIRGLIDHGAFEDCIESLWMAEWMKARITKLEAEVKHFSEYYERGSARMTDLEVELVKHQWVSVEDRLPESGKRIEIYWKNSYGKEKTSLGWYAKKHNIVDEGDYYEQADYCEEKDEYYFNEGFWEVLCESETAYLLSNVTHWKPITLPEREQVMNKQTEKLLAATDAELPALLGEVLQPETQSWHKWKYNPHDWDHFEDNCCIKCNVLYKEKVSGSCLASVPIPINDWNVAMWWRDWAVKEYGKKAFFNAMNESYLAEMRNKGDAPHVNWSVPGWFAFYAQPKHFEIAAAICKEASK